MLETEKPQSVAEKVERPPALDRIVSERMSNQEKEALKDIFLDKFNGQSLEGIENGKIELSSSQLKLVEEANRLTNKALAGLGVRSNLDIGSEQVYLVRSDVFKRFLAENITALSSEIIIEDAEGLLSRVNQKILIKENEQIDLKFLENVMHEMLHMKSFYSVQTVGPKAKTGENPGSDLLDAIIERRDGLRMRGIAKTERGTQAGSLFFERINEALIEKIVVELIRNFRIDLSPKSRESLDRSESFRTLLLAHIETSFQGKGDLLTEEEKLKILLVYPFLRWEAILLPEAGVFMEEYEKEKDPKVLDKAIDFYCENFRKMSRFSYSADRMFLDKLIARLYHVNRNDFNSANDIFLIFIEAAFEGRLLPLARIIEKTFGKGSFKKLGEGIDITAEGLNS